MKAFSKFLRSLVATSRPPEGTVLSPDDFPLTVIGTKLSKPDGAPVAIATDTDTAGTGEDYSWAEELFISSAGSKEAQGRLTGRHHIAFQAKDRSTVQTSTKCVGEWWG